MDITPGSKVTVKVTKTISNAAAGKTLARLFGKDPAARRRSKPKNLHHKRRGGRIWRSAVRGTVLRTPAVGQSATLLATVDVIRDLNSVSRFVQITPDNPPASQELTPPT